MALEQQDDMAIGIERFEAAIAALEADDNPKNRHVVQMEGRGLRAIFEDESHWKGELHPSHGRLKVLFDRAEPLMAKTPDGLSAQFAEYADYIRNCTIESINNILETLRK